MEPYEILHLTVDHPRYADVILRAAADPDLTRALREDGAILWDLNDQTTWTVVLRAGTAEIMAMAAWRLTDEHGVPVALCRSNHHVRAYRGYPWWHVAFAAQHEQIRGMRARTWVYGEPRPLLEALGWRVVDEGLTPEHNPPRRWYEMRREPDVA